MKKLTFLICLALIAGCSSIQTERALIKEPELLKQAALPLIPQSIYRQDMDLVSDILVSSDGTVERASFHKSSGDKDWDALAIASILKWKFTPAMYNGKPIKLLIRRKIKIQFAEPEMMNLAEIVFVNLKQADSAYKALMAGSDFNKIVSKYSVSPSRINNGLLGEVNIQNYSKNISSVLSDLNEGQISKPIPYGQNYIIFKRLKKIESVDKSKGSFGKEIIKNKENFFIDSNSYVTL